MQNLLLDREKNIHNIFNGYTKYALVGAESIEIVVELGFNALQHILVIWSAVSSPNHTVSSSVNDQHTCKSIKPLRRNISFSNVIFI